MTYVDQFNYILSCYGVKMAYYFDEPFQANAHVVPVMCPICRKIISGSLALSNDSDTGFADSNFKIDDVKPCCGFQDTINHEQLRRRFIRQKNLALHLQVLFSRFELRQPEPVGFRCLHKERKPTDSISTQDRTGGDVYQQKREIHVQKKIADNRSKLPTIQPHLPHNSTRRYNPNPRRSSGLCRETRSFCGGYQRPRLVRVPHQGRSYC